MPDTLPGTALPVKVSNALTIIRGIKFNKLSSNDTFHVPKCEDVI